MTAELGSWLLLVLYHFVSLIFAKQGAILFCPLPDINRIFPQTVCKVASKVFEYNIYCDSSREKLEKSGTHKKLWNNDFYTNIKINNEA